MKVQPLFPQIQQQQNNIDNKKGNINFRGLGDFATLGLRFLDTNQAWGANAVDLGFMVIPRTTVDLVNRGPAAGVETGRREASGTANHSLVGVYGMLAGLLLAIGINSKYGIKANKLFVDNETLDFLGKAWDKQVKAGNESPLKAYLQDVFKGAETRIGDDWKSIPQDKIDIVVAKYSEALNDNKAPVTISKDLKEYAKSVIMHATGAENSFRLEKTQQPSSISNLLENVYNVSRTFVTDKVGNAFKESKDIASNKFLKSLKHVNLGRSLLGVGIASAIGMSIQPLNIYITKKKTGSDGFVGVEGREKDKSTGFKFLKAAAAAAFGAGTLATIGTKGGLNGIIKKIQFKGLVPTLDQFKFIYGVTIMSRFMVARDKDELREGIVKDTLGYLNWLILGNFVAKMVANSLDQNLLNYSEKEHGKGFFNKLIKSPMYTRDEVLHRALKAANIDTIENGKALTFKQMLKKLEDSRISAALRKETKGKMRALSIAQVAGYIYSGLVLGVGIPKLNIYMTNKSEAKRKARLAAEKAKNEVAKQPKQQETTQTKSQESVTQATTTTVDMQYKSMMKPGSKAFFS